MAGLQPLSPVLTASSRFIWDHRTPNMSVLPVPEPFGLLRSPSPQHDSPTAATDRESSAGFLHVLAGSQRNPALTDNYSHEHPSVARQPIFPQQSIRPTQIRTAPSPLRLGLEIAQVDDPEPFSLFGSPSAVLGASPPQMTVCATTLLLFCTLPSPAQPAVLASSPEFPSSSLR